MERVLFAAENAPRRSARERKRTMRFAPPSAGRKCRNISLEPRETDSQEEEVLAADLSVLVDAHSESVAVTGSAETQFRPPRFVRPLPQCRSTDCLRVLCATVASFGEGALATWPGNPIAAARRVVGFGFLYPMVRCVASVLNLNLRCCQLKSRWRRSFRWKRPCPS